MRSRIAKQPEITLISPEGKPVRRSEYFECPEVVMLPCTRPALKRVRITAIFYLPQLPLHQDHTHDCSPER